MALPVVTTLRRSFKFRLYPNQQQTRDLEEVLETHRRIYNRCLEERKTAWETEQRNISWVDQCGCFSKNRSQDAFQPKIAVNSGQGTIRRLDKAFASFFRRVKAGQKPGYPRFKNRDRFSSFDFPAYGNGIKLVDGKLRIFGVGLVRIKQHRPVEGTIKTVAIKREADKWYAVFSCAIEVAITPSKKPAFGVDLGLETFLTGSNGQSIKNPRYLKTVLPELRRKQRALARKQRGSKRRGQAKRRVAALYAKVSNARKHYHHKTANQLVKRFGTIAVERLNVRGMLKNRWLARSISDVGWSQFVQILKHKAESAGARVIEVDPRGTSQECSGCGKVVKKPLSQRWHSCPCGVELHRDHNAAKNILARAVKPPARGGPAKRNASNGKRASKSHLE